VPVLTLARPDEKSIPPGLNKRAQERENAQEKILQRRGILNETPRAYLFAANGNGYTNRFTIENITYSFARVKQLTQKVND